MTLGSEEVVIHSIKTIGRRYGQERRRAGQGHRPHLCQEGQDDILLRGRWVPSKSARRMVAGWSNPVTSRARRWRRHGEGGTASFPSPGHGGACLPRFATAHRRGADHFRAAHGRHDGQGLDLQPGLKVLEVGGGSGYHAAVMAELVRPDGHVYSMERIQSLADRARKNLECGRICRPGHDIVGDGSKGCSTTRRSTASSVACSAGCAAAAFEQLEEGGKMLIPVGGRNYQELYLVTKVEGKMRKRTGRRAIRSVDRGVRFPGIGSALQPRLWPKMNGSTSDRSWLRTTKLAWRAHYGRSG